MKRNSIKNMFFFIIGGLVFGTISVFATATILSTNVEYDPRDTEWGVENVEDALDDLYVKVNEGGYLNIKGVDLIVNKAESVSSITFTPSDEYKYYLLTDVWWSASNTAYTTLLNYIAIKSITNATYVESGKTGRNANGSVGAARSYLITPVGGDNITVTFNTTADSVSVYGFK